MLQSRKGLQVLCLQVAPVGGREVREKREGGDGERDRRGGGGGERGGRDGERERDSDIICIQKIAAYIHQIL